MCMRQVRWQEGMLILPHHFQLAESNLREGFSTGLDLIEPCGYGIFALDVNLPSISNYEVRINHLQARFKDGTIISIPDNGRVETLNVQDELTAASEIYVFLSAKDSPGPRELGNIHGCGNVSASIHFRDGNLQRCQHGR